MKDWHYASPPIRPVELKDIDITPGPFCMSFGFDPNPLIQSIKSVGLVNPPFLIKNRHGRLIVIIGYRRIQTMKSLNQDIVPCRVFSESELLPIQCLLLSLYDNLVTRKLNEVEKGMVLSRLASYLPRIEILTHYMPLLDLPSHESTFLLFRDIEEVLDKEIKEYIAQGLLSLQAIKTLLDLDHNARSCLSHLVVKLKFNINQQIQLIDYIIDLSHRRHKSISEFLENHSLQNICADTRLNNPQKAKAVLHLLRSERLPTLVEAEKIFNKNVSSLNLPEGAKITHSQFFEAPDYRLEILFREGRELKLKLERLYSTTGIEDLRNPWEQDS
jgi:ParB family chromosome partitioning protein